MKIRILAYGITPVHDSITSLTAFSDPISISDFDAFVIDLDGLGRDSFSIFAFERRQAELKELVERKGGVIVCIVRPSIGVNATPQTVLKYSLFEMAAASAVYLFTTYTRAGTGSNFKLTQSIGKASSAFFRTLQDNLLFTAFLDAPEHMIAERQGAILAVNSVEKPIAVEFSLDEGLIAFLPVPHNVPGERLGAAIVNMVRKHYAKQAVLDEPGWVNDIIVPASDAHDSRIVNLLKEREKLAEELNALEAKREELLNFRRLLFTYGKGLLEPEVRRAFRLFGFSVPEPEEYTGEWDVELRDNNSRPLALGEVERIGRSN